LILTNIFLSEAVSAITEASFICIRLLSNFRLSSKKMNIQLIYFVCYVGIVRVAKELVVFLAVFLCCP